MLVVINIIMLTMPTILITGMFVIVLMQHNMTIMLNMLKHVECLLYISILFIYYDAYYANYQYVQYATHAYYAQHGAYCAYYA